MHIGALDLFRIGIGPSSSHTVGPMKAARLFAAELSPNQPVARVRAELFGSLGATGKGHGSDKAVLLGLLGETPEGIDLASVPQLLETAHAAGRLKLACGLEVCYREAEDLLFHREESLPAHPNGMRFTALDATGQTLVSREFYSVGGGFIIDRDAGEEHVDHPPGQVPYPFESGAELLALCEEHGLSISALMWRNERAFRPEVDVGERLLEIWAAMRESVHNGCENEGVLPGGLGVKRRAPELFRKLSLSGPSEIADGDPMSTMDWVDLWALAVNEENAAGGRVVTAPTNGAAGIIPAVLHYATEIVGGGSDNRVQRFLLAAASIGALYKKNASISGADVGCQGEVGVACSMAAAALAEYRGATPKQVENAAEIGMEHNLGLTCDPIGGLVQIPCIERNAMGAVKAINAARMALGGDGSHHVSLDKVIKTMRETGRDMQAKYKETSRGGLAVNVIEC